MLLHIITSLHFTIYIDIYLLVYKWNVIMTVATNQVINIDNKRKNICINNTSANATFNSITILSNNMLFENNLVNLISY